MTVHDIDAVVRRMDRYHALRKRDGLLHLMAVLGSSGLPVAIGLIVDGLVIRGAFGSARQLASSADHALSRALEAFATEWDDDSRQQVSGAFGDAVDRIEREREESRALVEKYMTDAEVDSPVDIDEVESSEISAYYEALAWPPALELQQAQILVGGEWVRVGIMRVEVNHIAAWWPLDEEENATVTYGGGPTS